MLCKTINNYILKLGSKIPVTALVVKKASNSSSALSKITKHSCWDDNYGAVSKETSIGETSSNMVDIDISDALTTSKASVTSTSNNSTTFGDEIFDEADAIKSNTTTSVAIGGCPKGSTTANILDQKTRNELATQSVVQFLAEMQSKKNQSGSRIENGALMEIIIQVKQDYQLPDNIVILESTMHQ